MPDGRTFFKLGAIVSGFVHFKDDKEVFRPKTVNYTAEVYIRLYGHFCEK